MDEGEPPPWDFDSWIHGWSTTASDEGELLSYIRARRRTLAALALPRPAREMVSSLEYLHPSVILSSIIASCPLPPPRPVPYRTAALRPINSKKGKQDFL